MGLSSLPVAVLMPEPFLLEAHLGWCLKSFWFVFVGGSSGMLHGLLNLLPLPHYSHHGNQIPFSVTPWQHSNRNWQKVGLNKKSVFHSEQSPVENCRQTEFANIFGKLRDKISKNNEYFNSSCVKTITNLSNTFQTKSNIVWTVKASKSFENTFIRYLTV